MLETPLYMQAEGLEYSARQDRNVLGLIASEGVIGQGSLVVSQRALGANMSVDVAAGPCMVVGDDEAEQGSYLCRSTAVVNVPVPSAPGANSRIDMVIARVRDGSVTGASVSDWVLEVISGDVAAAPVAPPVPPSAIALAQFPVPAGTLSITAAAITDLRDVSSRSTVFDPGPVTRLPNDYPAGVSVGRVTVADGWPVNGTLSTFKREGTRMWQELVSASASLNPVQRYFRQGYGASNGWSAWQNVLNGGTLQQASIGAGESTTSATFGPLATAGPVATVTIGPSGRALVIVSARIVGDVLATAGLMGFTVSGASSRVGIDAESVRLGGDQPRRSSAVTVASGLTPGSNTFTAVYKTGGSGSATFAQRELIVLPL